MKPHSTTIWKLLSPEQKRAINKLRDQLNSQEKKRS